MISISCELAAKGYPADQRHSEIMTRTSCLEVGRLLTGEHKIGVNLHPGPEHNQGFSLNQNQLDPGTAHGLLQRWFEFVIGDDGVDIAQRHNPAQSSFAELAGIRDQNPLA